MKQQRWTYQQVVNYLIPNYPCGSGAYATGPGPWEVIDDAIADGRLTAYSTIREMGDFGPIEAPKAFRVPKDEWRRDERGRLEWEGYCAKVMEFVPAEVKKLCEHGPKNNGGRRPKFDYEGALIHLANRIFNDPSFSNPGKEDLFNAMRDWFAENGSTDGTQPDTRQIQDRAARFYREVIGYDD